MKRKYCSWGIYSVRISNWTYCFVNRLFSRNGWIIQRVHEVVKHFQVFISDQLLRFVGLWNRFVSFCFHWCITHCCHLLVIVCNKPQNSDHDNNTKKNSNVFCGLKTLILWLKNPQKERKCVLKLKCLKIYGSLSFQHKS